ncbi:F-box only protein 44-like [Anabas testudineus]|nr:F-box only protein 44-like [Anabas testudineus]
MCRKSQLIDLEREGYNPEFMDHFQPDIKISDWYEAQWENCSKYGIYVELLNQNKEPVHTFAPKAVFVWLGNSAKWNQMSHVFQNYGPGVRYIRFTHGGEDTAYWGDVYGVRLTDSCVEICPSVETQ